MALPWASYLFLKMIFKERGEDKNKPQSETARWLKCGGTDLTKTFLL